jgi:hypothetical protein
MTFMLTKNIISQERRGALLGSVRERKEEERRCQQETWVPEWRLCDFYNIYSHSRSQK